MLQRSASGFKKRSLKSSVSRSAPTLSKIRVAIKNVFSRPAHLRWYCQQVGVANLDPGSAVDDFFKRSEFFDISPVRFFDPQWFRAKFPVTGVNAFLSYVTNDAQRLAPPSPLFAPRWYARRYRLFRSAMHPFLDYLMRRRRAQPASAFRRRVSEAAVRFVEFQFDRTGISPKSSAISSAAAPAISTASGTSR